MNNLTDFLAPTETSAPAQSEYVEKRIIPTYPNGYIILSWDEFWARNKHKWTEKQVRYVWDKCRVANQGADFSNSTLPNDVDADDSHDIKRANDDIKFKVDLALKYRFGVDYTLPERLSTYIEPGKSLINSYLEATDYISFGESLDADMRATLSDFCEKRLAQRGGKSQTIRERIGDELYDAFYLGKPLKSSEITNWEN